MDAKKEIEKLREEIEYHNRLTTLTMRLSYPIMITTCSW